MKRGGSGPLIYSWFNIVSGKSEGRGKDEKRKKRGGERGEKKIVFKNVNEIHERVLPWLFTW